MQTGEEERNKQLLNNILNLASYINDVQVNQVDQSANQAHTIDGNSQSNVLSDTDNIVLPSKNRFLEILNNLESHALKRH